MRVLMLGWEFPPYISGGLGTACYGLTRAMAARGIEISFVLPKAVDRSHASHVDLISPDAVPPKRQDRIAEMIRSGRTPEELGIAPWEITTEMLAALKSAGAEYAGAADDFENVSFHAVPSNITSPYGEGSPLTAEEIGRLVREGRISQEFAEELAAQTGQDVSDVTPPEAAPSGQTPGFLGLSRAAGQDYGGDLMGDVRRYAQLVVSLASGIDFDVVHAHDWLTYPAGMAIARLTGKPLIVHVHSSEFDRSGEHVNQVVYDIERRGMHSAMRVITVSFWTKSIVEHRYGVDPAKIRVVWNGVDTDDSSTDRPPIRSDDKIVLYLGRITMQKGPEYFIQAAKRVLDKVDNVKFIVAGSGDMATRMIEMAAGMGIGHKVVFTGFLRGKDVARVFRMADCYVMPSVSEPFGIAPLEALSHNVPVIISKQSGVSEVLTHALKVDFWDVEEMANKIVAVLKYPPLGATMRKHGQFELRRITWEGAAEGCEDVYREAMASQFARV